VALELFASMTMARGSTEPFERFPHLGVERQLTPLRR
jgi:hypothetical protein